MINDTISLFRKNYRPKGSKSQITCFYSAPKGSKPSGIDASTKWTTNINEGKELLAKKITRGSTLTFTSSTITDTILKVTVEGKSLTGKRKRPQNHGLTEPGLQATDVSALKIILIERGFIIGPAHATPHELLDFPGSKVPV